MLLCVHHFIPFLTACIKSVFLSNPMPNQAVHLGKKTEQLGWKYWPVEAFCPFCHLFTAGEVQWLLCTKCLQLLVQFLRAVWYKKRLGGRGMPLCTREICYIAEPCWLKLNRDSNHTAVELSYFKHEAAGCTIPCLSHLLMKHLRVNFFMGIFPPSHELANMTW